MIKISLIIPVFNLEKYIIKCLESVFDQNLPSNEYEIIIVDDGSTDRSLELIKTYSNAKTNVHIVQQENLKQSVARNNGLSIAKGKYVWFIDGDDWIQPNCLSEIISICESSELEILHFGAMTRGLKVSEYAIKQEFCSDLLLGSSMIEAREVKISVCTYIFRRSFLNDNKLLFMEGVYHEDNAFIPQSLFYAKRMMCVNQPYYNVFKRLGSTTTTPNPKRMFDLIAVTASLIHFASQIQTKKTKSAVYYYAGLTINSAFILALQLAKADVSSFWRELKKESDLIARAMICSRKPKYILEGILLYVSPTLFRNIAALRKIIPYKQYD